MCMVCCHTCNIRHRLPASTAICTALQPRLLLFTIISKSIVRFHLKTSGACGYQKQNPNASTMPSYKSAIRCKAQRQVTPLYGEYDASCSCTDSTGAPLACQWCHLRIPLACNPLETCQCTQPDWKHTEDAQSAALSLATRQAGHGSYT